MCGASGEYTVAEHTASHVDVDANVRMCGASAEYAGSDADVPMCGAAASDVDEAVVRKRGRLKRHRCRPQKRRKTFIPRWLKGDNATEFDDATGPPMPCPMFIPPARHPRLRPTKMSRKDGKTLCADSQCQFHCTAHGCIYCAAHCPGTQYSGDVCKVHCAFSERCTKDSVYCRKLFPKLPLTCIYLKCGVHCQMSACPIIPRPPSRNEKKAWD